MSSHLNAEVIRAHQLEIAASTSRAHHLQELRGRTERTSRVSSSRVRRGAALAAGLCLALAGAGVATASTGTSQSLTSGQLQYRIRALEAEGYVPASCIAGATRLYSARTHRWAEVKW
jgi:hypothetical protein